MIFIFYYNFFAEIFQAFGVLYPLNNFYKNPDTFTGEKIMKVVRNIFIIMLAFILVAAVACTAYYFIATADVRLQKEKLLPSDDYATVLDVYGKEAAEISFVNADKKVSVSELPEYTKTAFIASEDKKFYRHHGLDYARIVKAAMTNIGARSFKQGASTISQQLIKNTHLTNEKTFKRKLREIKLTRQLEKNYSKDEILELYLNTIYFGHNCYGIAGAADFYFSKSAQTLTPAESAMLAAIIRSPNNYSPFVNASKCLSARNSVLKRMFEQGYISEAEYESAKNEPLPVRAENSISSRSYLRGVSEELESLTEIYSPYRILRGAKIYTYLEPELQKYLENLSTDADRSGKSILIENNKTYGIAACYTSEGNIPRQPGSLIKPLAVYAPALEENIISACTPIADEKTDFDGYSPSNYKDAYHGYVSARRALAESMNVPAVKILSKLGIEKSETYLSAMGLKLEEEDKTLSLALGGISRGFTLRKIAAAYALFANEGVFAPSAFISKIVDCEGNILYQRNPIKTRVFSDDTVFIINDMLKEAVKSGTAKKLASFRFDLCAKTGTVGNEEGNTDAYAVSYTSEHTVGVWMGNADNAKTDITGGGLPCHYAMLINKFLYTDAPPAPFAASQNVQSASIDQISYEKYHEVLLADPKEPRSFTFEDIFRKSNLPAQTSDLFSSAKTEADISCRNNKVYIDICQAEYFDICVKRKNNGQSKIIYEGKNKQICDDDIKEKVKYIYSVTPYFTDKDGNKVYGSELILPEIYVKKFVQDSKEDRYGAWWKDAG